MCEDAKLLVVSFGTCARICYDAISMARKAGIMAGLFRPITLWPFPYEELSK